MYYVIATCTSTVAHGTGEPVDLRSSIPLAPVLHIHDSLYKEGIVQECLKLTTDRDAGFVFFQINMCRFRCDLVVHPFDSEQVLSLSLFILGVTAYRIKPMHNRNLRQVDLDLLHRQPDELHPSSCRVPMWSLRWSLRRRRSYKDR